MTTNTKKLTGAETSVVVAIKGGATVEVIRGTDGIWYAPGVEPSRSLRIVRRRLAGHRPTA